jgi:hypothetical protein
MKSVFIVALIASLFLFSCNNGEKNPDVSDIRINLTTDRFEKKLFDTSAPSLTAYLQRLESTNPSFTATYLKTILNAEPQWPADTTAAFVNEFVKAFRPVYDSAEKIFNDFSPFENEIKKGLQFVKHYFPGYKVPEKIITYIGPLDGYGDIISEEGLLIGLHHHLGKDYSLYKSELVRATYPDYISSRFEPDYIAVNCMKNIVYDIYPEKESDKSLINQMIEKGKRLYILNRFLPATADYKLIGYTEKQMKDCYTHEAAIWDLFVKNSYLQTTDKNISKNFVDEGPKTQELGEGAPGNVGSFAGWQIVKKYMQKNPATSLQQLIELDEETLFQAAKYKP